MVVRDALGVALPAAGVGCAFSRRIIRRFEDEGAVGASPFSVESLTEDYEMGMKVRGLGGRSRFLRVRGDDGQLVATRACFPSTLQSSVRQKSRWVHGIAFQSWERLGWSWNLPEFWMRMHDRRGPITALVMASGYALLLLAGLHLALRGFDLAPELELSPGLVWLMQLNFLTFLWRVTTRFGFTAREYGWGEGVRAILRIPLANLIAILAGRRAFMAYARSLRGASVAWEKTSHRRTDHPVLFASREPAH